MIFTDHKPLTYAFTQRRDKCSPRQFKHLDFISQFTTDIRHISGQDIVVADALSRVDALCTPVSPEALAEAEETDPELNTLCRGPLPSAWRRSRFPALTCLCTATRQQQDHSRKSPRPSEDRYSIPSTLWATSGQG